MSIAYDNALANLHKEVNVIVNIDGQYYGIKQPDSGLILPSEHLILDDPSINGVDIDIRRANTPVGSFSFKLKDEDEFITKVIMLEPNNFLEKDVLVYVGFITGSFDFTDYKQVAKTRINSVTKIANGYSIVSKEVTSLLSNPTYNVSDKLDINILPVSLSLDLQDASAFPDSGLLKINDEFIRYDGKTDNTLENLERSQLGSTAAAHELGNDVFLVTELVDLNPIDMLLQLMLSKNGDLVNNPIYDVLKNGLGIPTEDVDVAGFENIRDSIFEGELFRLYLFGEEDTLKFIEAEILQPTNTRLIVVDGIITLTVLDQIEVGADVIEINEDVIIGTPTWSLTSDKIHNVVKISYDYEEKSGRYLSTLEFKDTDSINTFGEKKPLTFRFKGIKSDINGGSIVAKRAQQLLTRLSTARGSVRFRALFDVENIPLGADILLNHRFLPQQGGGLGINDQIEVISKNVDLKNATCDYKLEYTSFTGIRVPFIAPSPLITGVIDQKTFTVPDGSCFRVGFALVLWDNLNHGYLPDEVNFIQSIEGNTITMVNEFISVLSTDVRIKLADYNNASNDQKSRYAYIGFNTGFFEDGTKSYQIIF